MTRLGSVNAARIVDVRQPSAGTRGRLVDLGWQRPFAIVIVAGLISRLFIGFFVNPVLYEMVAREGDVLQV
jgi:hypothetical protein